MSLWVAPARLCTPLAMSMPLIKCVVIHALCTKSKISTTIANTVWSSVDNSRENFEWLRNSVSNFMNFVIFLTLLNFFSFKLNSLNIAITAAIGTLTILELVFTLHCKRGGSSDSRARLKRSETIALAPACHWHEWRLDSGINDAWYRWSCTCCCRSRCVLELVTSVSGRDVIDNPRLMTRQMSHAASTREMLFVCLQYILLLCFLLITEVVVTSIVTIFRERVSL